MVQKFNVFHLLLLVSIFQALCFSSTRGSRIVSKFQALSHRHHGNKNESGDSPFVNHGVVPDVIDQDPQAGILTVQYKASEAEVNVGNILTRSQALQAPTVTFDGEEGKLYTLNMVDPDAPSRLLPLLREINHWLVVNIPGGNVSAGETLAAYGPPGPPLGSGLHRYIFILYEQLGGKMTVDPADHPHTNFSSRKFAKKYNLSPPLRANFFQAQFTR